MELLKLQELSVQNRDKLMEIFEALSGASHRTFAEHIREKGCVTINRPTKKLTQSLEAGKLLTVHDHIALNNPGKSEEECDQIMKTLQPDHYVKRNAFESFLENGRVFKYGALNIGNMGAYSDSYGHFCIVIKKEILKEFYLVFLKNDSLQFYVSGSGTIDFDSFKKDISCNEYVPLLAAIKHHQHITSTNSEDWPDILCSGVNYVEALIKDDILLTDIAEIRIKKSDFENYNKLVLKLLSDSIKDSEKAEAKYFSDIRTYLNQNNLTFKVV